MNKRGLLFCLVAVFYYGCKNGNKTQTKLAAKPSVVKEKWHWNNETKQNNDAGYSQVVKVGNSLYISGVPTSDLSPKGISELYKTLEKCLNSFGASSKNVVKETLYTTDIEAMKKYNEVRKEFYKGDFPAATWVQINRLYEPNAKLEVDLVAYLSEDN
jgi:2-iminobutanoate/2-iminopropanoate deaminase